MALDPPVPFRRPLKGSAGVVVLPAEIDIANSDGVAAMLCVRLRSGTVIADLTTTTFCDSSGAVALAWASQVGQILGHDLLLAVRPGGAVSRLLERTGLAPHLYLYASASEAAGACP